MCAESEDWAEAGQPDFSGEISYQNNLSPPSHFSYQKIPSNLCASALPVDYTFEFDIQRKNLDKKSNLPHFACCGDLSILRCKYVMYLFFLTVNLTARRFMKRFKEEQLRRR